MKALLPEWSLLTLNDLQAKDPGAITDGPFGSNLTSAHYTESGPRVVRLQNIGDGVFVDTRAHISEEHFASLRKHEVRSGDLLIASLGEVLPRACIAPQHLGPAIVKADCIRIRMDESIVDVRFVHYWLQTPAVRAWAKAHVHGVGRPRLGLTTLRTLPVALPELAEQRHIVEILEDHLSRLDSAGHSLHQALARARPLELLETESLVHRHSSERIRLVELLDRVEAGRSFGGSAPPAAPGEWGIVKVSAMTWGTFRPQENKAVPAASVDPRFEIHDGDLLVSRANTTSYVGAAVLVDNPPARLLLSDKSLRLVPRLGVQAAWLTAVLSMPSTRRQISGLATGTKDSMRNISQANLLSIDVPAGTSSQQTEVVVERERIRARSARLKTQLQAAEQRSRNLRKALLAVAFSGRLSERASFDQIEEMAGV